MKQVRLNPPLDVHAKARFYAAMLEDVRIGDVYIVAAVEFFRLPQEQVIAALRKWRDRPPEITPQKKGGKNGGKS